MVEPNQHENLSSNALQLLTSLLAGLFVGVMSGVLVLAIGGIVLA